MERVKTRAARRLLPGPIDTSVLVVATLVGILMYATDRPQDPAIRNVIAMVLGLLALVSLWTWFVFRSGYAPRWRRLAGTLGLLVIVVLGATVRIDGFSGNLVPRFRWAWQPPSDIHLELPEATEQSVSLQSATPDDFPQFLGPYRNGTLPDVQLRAPGQAPRVIWKQPIGAGWSAFAAVNGYAVTMEQRGPRELVTCYEIQTGRLIWSHAVPVRHETLMGGVGPRATPTLDGGRVFAMGATGILRCLDGATGELIWQHDVPTEFGVPPQQDTRFVAWGRSNSPLVFDGKVVVPAGGPTGQTTSLVAYRAEDGQRLWVAGEEQISYSSPILTTVHGQPQIIVVNESSVTGHDPDSGSVLWRFPWPGNSSLDANTSQPHVYQDTVLVSKGYGGGLARFRVADGQTSLMYHNRQVLKTKLTSFVIRGPYAFGLSDGILECVHLDNGQRQWKGGRYGHGQLLLVGNHLLVLSEKGELAVVDASPENYREWTRIAVLDGQTWNNLCLYGRYLLVRNAQEAACLEIDCQRITHPEPVANPPR